MAPAWRASAVGTGLALSEMPQRVGAAARALKGRRPVWFPKTQGFAPCPVYDRYRLSPADRLVGPAIVEERESTIVLPPGSTTEVDRHGNLVTELS